ncbi:MAG TPA: polysaccharide pyruvyl transferase CsaB [Clostridia bacterium]|nr:polysaccharide pyruvyl transferase CsaB [Clostridia bacterium]
MGKRIVISGYYGFNNVGDEAVLFSMLRTLRAQRPDLKITVLSQDPEKTARAYGVQAVNRWRLKEVWQALRQCDLFISGGGSLLQDVTSSRNVFYYLGLVQLAKLLGKKVFFYAQGVGPISRKLSREVMRRVVNQVDLVTVRDEDSKRLLLELGVTKPEILVKADAVLGLYAKEMDRQPGLKYLAKNEVQLGEGAPPIIGISVRDWHQFQGYKKAVAAVGDRLVREGYQVVFLPFHFPDDIAPSREIAKMMEEPAVVIRDELGVVEMLGCLSAMHLLIGMRLHALIMAGVMGVPIVGISYDPKVDAFMKAVGQPVAGRVETLAAEVLAGEVDRILANRETVTAQLAEAVGALRVEARDTGRLALQLLQEQP